MKLKSGTVGYVELIATSIIWGVTYVLMKYSLSFLDPQQIAFSRFLIAALMFVPVLFLTHEKYGRGELLTLVILALTGVLLYQLLFIWGEDGLTAANASFIVSFEPIFIVVLGISLKRDKISWTVSTGLILSTIGMVILLKPTALAQSEVVSAILVLLSALSWAIFTIVGKDLLEKHNPLNVTGYVTIIGLLMLLPFVNFGALALFSLTNIYLIIALLFIGILATFAGYFLWFDGLKKVRPVTAGTTLYITPFVTVIFASMLISEPISIATIVGGSVILVGLAVTGIRLRSIQSR
ncbi:MAG: EamA family transporter [Thermoplasmatales archaeon]|nr:EamA family transporter [Candidatus Thermoplasmatota archaeon]MCL6002546.1 EamA family transporter [Candidatus Thermoplasmatota archaeon]MDA8054828.1 EamA family transporter [Thermoplasmatales archaeon]